MELLQNRFQLAGDRQTEMGGVLNKGQTLVRDVEEDDRCAYNGAVLDHIEVENVSDTDKREDKYLLEDSLKADSA